MLIQNVMRRPATIRIGRRPKVFLLLTIMYGSMYDSHQHEVYVCNACHTHCAYIITKTD